MNIDNLNRATNVALSFILAAGLSLPVTGLAYAADDNDTSSEVKEKLNNLFTSSNEDENVAKKTESVYVFTKADGTVKNTIVSDWLKNADKDDTIHDVSSLTDIENTEGKESFEAKGESLVWDADGNDIYYQGNTDKKAPIELKVSYWLDDKEVPADKMLGKSGHVKIRYEFKNNSYSTEYVDGAARTIYTPFVCVTGLILDNDKFSNITTDHAKAVNDGDRTFVGGFAMPGLQEDLDLDSDDFDIPSSFEIEADVEDFEMSTSATFVTSNLFDDLNTDELDDGDIKDALDSLQDGMDQLLDGTSDLYDGLKKLDDGGEQLKDGSAELAEKTADLPDSAQQLADGSSAVANGLVAAVDGTAQLILGNKQVSAGLESLANGTDTTTGLKDAVAAVEQLQAGVGDSTSGLTGGLTRVSGALGQLQSSLSNSVSGGLKGAQTQVEGIKKVTDNAATNAGDAAASANDTADKIDAILNNGDEYFAGLDDGQRKEIEDALTEAKNNAQNAAESATEAEKFAKSASSNLKKDEGDTSTTSLSDTLTALKSGVDTASGTLGTLNGSITEQLIPGSNTISAGLGQLNNGTAEGETTADGKTSSGLKGALEAVEKKLKAGNDQITDKMGDLNDGLQTASDGASAISDGLAQLNESVPALAAGITALKDGSEQLSDGLDAAKDGADKLKDGLEQFNDEGIQKIIDAYNDNLAGLVDRVKATAEAGKAYDNFSGKSDEVKGSVKFIFETDAIEHDDDEDSDSSNDAVDASESAATSESESE